VSGSGEEQDVYDEINVTPMLDLAYVLLVIFIIMTTASVQGIKVNLPKASATPAIAKPKTKAISITADGTIYIDTFPVTLPELESLLRQFLGRLGVSARQPLLRAHQQLDISRPRQMQQLRIRIAGKLDLRRILLLLVHIDAVD